MFQDRCYERDVDINNNFFADNMTNNMDTDFNMNNGADYQVNDNSCNTPIMEPMQEKCVHRTIMHEVNHVCPIRTKIINHHVYRHTFTPCYTCCEENEFSNVYENNNCCF